MNHQVGLKTKSRHGLTLMQRQELNIVQRMFFGPVCGIESQPLVPRWNCPNLQTNFGDAISSHWPLVRQFWKTQDLGACEPGHHVKAISWHSFSSSCSSFESCHAAKCDAGLCHALPTLFGQKITEKVGFQPGHLAEELWNFPSKLSKRSPSSKFSCFLCVQEHLVSFPKQWVLRQSTRKIKKLGVVIGYVCVSSSVWNMESMHA